MTADVENFEERMCKAILHYLKLNVSFGSDIFDVEYNDNVLSVSYCDHTPEKDKIIIDTVEQLKKEIF